MWHMAVLLDDELELTGTELLELLDKLLLDEMLEDVTELLELDELLLLRDRLELLLEDELILLELGGSVLDTLELENNELAVELADEEIKLELTLLTDEELELTLVEETELTGTPVELLDEDAGIEELLTGIDKLLDMETLDTELVLCELFCSLLAPPQATKLKLKNTQTPCFHMFIAVSQYFSQFFIGHLNGSSESACIMSYKTHN